MIGYKSIYNNKQESEKQNAMYSDEKVVTSSEIEQSFLLLLGTVQSGFDIDKALSFLNDNALDKSSGRCAYFVRQALEAGGISTNPHPISAKDYGPYLTKWGFTTVSLTNYKPVRGDIGVIQSYPGGSTHGHIQMYNGSIWISDFKQKVDFWPGGGYRTNQPSFHIYRWGTYQ